MLKVLMFLLALWNGQSPPVDTMETTRTVVLIRHAKSSWDDPKLDDFDRPLEERGLRDAPVMAAKLAEYNLPIDLVIASPSRRTTQTLEYFRSKLKIPDNRIIWDSTIFHSSTANLLRILTSLDDSIHHVVLVGHNPSMTDLANTLQSDTLIENVPTCGIVHVGGDWQNWSAIRNEKGKLQFFIYPKFYEKP